MLKKPGKGTTKWYLKLIIQFKKYVTLTPSQHGILVLRDAEKVKVGVTIFLVAGREIFFSIVTEPDF